MPCGSRVRRVRPWYGRSTHDVGRPLPAKQCSALSRSSSLNDLEAERVRRGCARLAQHDAVMAALLERAQIDARRGLVGDLQAEAVDIEGARRGEIAHAELDMAEPHDVEGGIEDWVR